MHWTHACRQQIKHARNSGLIPVPRESISSQYFIVRVIPAQGTCSVWHKGARKALPCPHVFLLPYITNIVDYDIEKKTWGFHLPKYLCILCISKICHHYCRTVTLVYLFIVGKKHLFIIHWIINNTGLHQKRCTPIQVLLIMSHTCRIQ